MSTRKSKARPAPGKHEVAQAKVKSLTIPYEGVTKSKIAAAADAIADKLKFEDLIVFRKVLGDVADALKERIDPDAVTEKVVVVGDIKLTRAVRRYFEVEEKTDAIKKLEKEIDLLSAELKTKTQLLKKHQEMEVFGGNGIVVEKPQWRVSLPT